MPVKQRKQAKKSTTAKKRSSVKKTSVESSPAAPRSAAPVASVFDAEQIRDAPEHHAYARALGLLTWGTWDQAPRPADQRLLDFLATFPPGNPLKYLSGGSLERQQDLSWAPGSNERKLERFAASDWRPGSLHELLARYGLKLANAPARPTRDFVPRPIRETTKRRNFRLRVLHGGVDVEPQNMDEAKAEYLDRKEKEQAAADVRSALAQMREDLDSEEKKQ